MEVKIEWEIECVNAAKKKKKIKEEKNLKRNLYEVSQ